MLHRGSANHLEGDASAVRAIQDVGCLTAVKLVYHFPGPVAYDVLAGFEDCDIVVRAFSKTIKLARDLVTVKWQARFGAEFVVGGTRAVVYFDGSLNAMPHAAIAAFAGRLRAAGYDRILYSQGPRPRCERCPAGLLKGCGGTGSP